MASDVFPEELAAKAAKDAKRAAVFTGLAVVVAIAVLAIDHGIKRAILEEAQTARGILNDFTKLSVDLKAAMPDGTEPAGEARAIPSGSGNADSGLDDPARAPAAADTDAGNRTAAKPRSTRGVQRGP